MGPALAPKHATDDLAWAQPWPPSMLPMILHGPSPGHPACYPMVWWGPGPAPKECYRCSCMGPALATQNATNGLAWAQPWSPRMLPTVLHGPSAAPHSTLPMLLHGPSPGHRVCYRRSCVGPALAPMYANDGLAWALPWPLSMLPMVLCRPITDPKACCRWSCMGPVLAPWNATDGLAWSHRWPPKCATDDLSWA